MIWAWASDSMHMQWGLEIQLPWLPILRRASHIALRCLWLQHPTGRCEAGTLLAGHTQAKHQSSTSISPVRRVPTSFNNLFFILSTWFQQATYLDASNLFDQTANIVLCGWVCVHACMYFMCQWGPSSVCACVCSLLACGVVHQPSGAVLWSVTFVWIGNVDLFRLKRHELESLVRTHDQKRLSALCQSTLLSPCEADVK